MDNLILGLLILQSRTIYEIKQRIDQGLNLMYSASLGSIQAAIKKLLALGCIECTETVENGKLKKIYSITDAGRARFNEWVNSPIDSSGEKHPELLKIYFMGLSDKNMRIERIEQQIAELREMYASLSAVCQGGEGMPVPDEYRDLFNYQLMSAKFGADFVKFQIDWYTDMLSKMKEGLL